MTAPVIPDMTVEPSPPRPRRRWSRVWIVLGVVAGIAAVFVLVSILALVAFHAREARPVPAFASLADQPDPSLAGTVAYTTGDDRCVRIVAAAGQPSKDVFCLGVWQPDPKAATEGKEMNAPQLVWRADGRLEVTMFRMPVGPPAKGKAPAYTAGWQKIVDVRTGAIEDVPAAELPAATNLTTRPTLSPSGQRVTASGNPSTGTVKVTLTDSAGSRTLLSAHGPGEYTYGLHAAFWSPDWQWIAVDDGRILITTTGTSPVTRVLVDGGGGWDDFPTFAVTAENFLRPQA